MKRLWSIFTDDMDCCMYTGIYGVERHHVFSHTSQERKLCEKYGFIAPLTPALHPNGVQCRKGSGESGTRNCGRGARNNYIAHYGSEEQFRQEFYYSS